MDNFILGISAIAKTIKNAVVYLSHLEIFWGFLTGFFVATLIHAFLISENPKDIPIILLNNKINGFRKLYEQRRKEDGTYTTSFSSFSDLASKVRFVFCLSCALFLGIILISLLKY